MFLDICIIWTSTTIQFDGPRIFHLYQGSLTTLFTKCWSVHYLIFSIFRRCGFYVTWFSKDPKYNVCLFLLWSANQHLPSVFVFRHLFWTYIYWMCSMIRIPMTADQRRPILDSRSAFKCLGKLLYHLRIAEPVTTVPEAWGCITSRYSSSSGNHSPWPRNWFENGTYE